MVDRNIRRFEQFQDRIARLYPEFASGEYTESGQVKTLSRTVTMQVCNNCNLACKYCVSGDTLIRMADYSLKPIKDIEIGDKILGFEEYPQKNKQTKVLPAIVEQKFVHPDKVIEVEFDTGEKIQITKNHKVLVRRNSNDNTYDYVDIGRLQIGSTVYHLPINDAQLELYDITYDDDYKAGYLVAMLKGDGSLKHYNRKNDGCDVFKFRLAVKDIEIIHRTKEYLDHFGIDTYIKPYLISKKYSLKQDAIFANTRKTYNAINQLYDTHFLKNCSKSYYQGFLAGIYDAEGHISQERVIRICNTDQDIITEIENGLKMLHIPYVLELDEKGTKNKPCKWNVRIVDNLNANSSYRFIKSVTPSLPRKSFEKFLNYSPLKRTTIKSITELNDEIDVYNIDTSTHTYIANGIAVHNCYQINKGHSSMSFETAKKFVDLLLSGEKGFKEYVDPSFSPAIVLEFIGGEPFLEIDLIDQVCDYFMRECIRLDHPWATMHMISICSNGILYSDPRVQRFLMKHRDHLSFSITIDGNKELHDSCRVFHDGSPSYDIAIAGAMDWMSKGNYMGSKITIAPGNITYLYDAIIHMIRLGYKDINANCVYEKGWEKEHATELYFQMKRIANYLLENNLENELFISLFSDALFKPKDSKELQTWCGGLGSMLSCDPNGFLYPCIRYMESSLGNDAPPLRIGSVDEGIAQQKCYCDNLKCITCVNRRTYNTDECFWCPIADGCADCAAYNYQVHGTPNKRAIFICEMHKARALANAYYWSKYNEKYRPEEKYNLYVSEEWALNIIPENEWNSLLSLPNIEYKGYINWQEVKRLDEESKGDLYGEEKEN